MSRKKFETEEGVSKCNLRPRGRIQVRTKEDGGGGK